MSAIYSADAWSKHAEDYHSHFSGSLVASIFDKIFPLLDAALAKGPVKLLDTAAGTGAELSQLMQHYGPSGPKADLGKNLSLIVTDFAPGMIEVIEKKIASKGADVQAKVELKVTDSQALDIADGSVQFATLLFGPNLIENPEKALKELNRVLAPGGSALIASLKTFEAYDVADKARSAIGVSNSVYESVLVGKWGDLAYVESQLTAAGFSNVKGKVHEGVAEATDPAAVLKSAKTNPTTSILYEGVTDKDAYIKARDEAAKALGTDAKALKVSANVAWGVKA